MSLLSEAEVSDFFDKYDGHKIMLANGKLFKTNVDLKKAEMEYYKLIGEAYNSKKLDRVQMNDQKPGTNFFTYIIDGQPKTMAHSLKNDKLYGYSKQVVNGKESPKLFSTTCSKLKYNTGNQTRLN